MKTKIYTVAHPEDLSPPVKNEGFCVDVVLASDYADLERELRAYEATVSNLESRAAAMAAESSARNDFVKTCFRAAAEGLSLSGAEIQELGIRLGLLGAEIYQPALHGYISGHEAGEDTVYVIKNQATEAAIVEIRSQGVEMFALMLAEMAIKRGETSGWKSSASNAASEYAQQLRAEASK